MFWGIRIGAMQGWLSGFEQDQKSLKVERVDGWRSSRRTTSRCDVAACAVAGPRIACLRMTGFVRKIL
jgi:hypothetical protein